MSEINGKPVGVKLPPTTGELVFSFMYSCIYGLVSFAPMMEFSETVPMIICTLVGNMNIFQATKIFSVIALSIGWLVSFCLLWHQLEHNFDYKRSLIVVAKWTAIAAGVYLLAIGSHVLIDSLLLKNIG